MPEVNINDIDLYYEIHGKGEPLLMIAGLASDSQSWQPLVEGLSEKFQLILSDNRGVGRTQAMNSETSVSVMADDNIALLDHLNIPDINLLGHSMGGMIAMEIAIRYPDRVKSLILADSAARNPKRNNALFQDWATNFEAGMNPEMWFRNFFYWIFTADFFEDETAVNEAARLSVECPYPQSAEALRKQVEAICDFDCTDKLKRIQASTLLIFGEQDLIYPPLKNIEILREIPDTSTTIIENAAHAVHVENPEGFIKAVLAFP